MDMTIAICDDEKSVRDQIGEQAHSLCPQAELAFCATGEELLALDTEPDIIFLDIQLPGKDGMEAADELRRRGCTAPLVFVTASEEYVFKAFDVGAFHYLVKPFSTEKLVDVLKRALKSLDGAMEKAASEERYIMVQSRGSHVKIKADDIVYAEVYNRKVIIHRRDGVVEYYGQLSDLEQMAGDDFFRPHRAYLINLKYVVQYRSDSIDMENGRVIMSKARFSEFVKAYLRYTQRKGEARE